MHDQLNLKASFFLKLKLNSYSNASIISSLCDELSHFHADFNATASDKMLMQSFSDAQ